MMLHRHFENERRQRENMTMLPDVTPGRTGDFVSEVFPPDEPDTDEPKKRGRAKKTETE